MTSTEGHTTQQKYNHGALNDPKTSIKIWALTKDAKALHIPSLSLPGFTVDVCCFTVIFK